MKTVNQMTVKEIIESIEVMRNGLSLNPGEREKQILLKNIGRAQSELQKREDQKKSVEPSANQGQLQKTPIRDASARVPQETKEEVAAWAKKVEHEAQNQHRDQAESTQAFEPTRVVIAKIENPTPITVPVVEMEFKDAKGNTYSRALDQADILSLLKTYFKRVAVSPKMEAKRYSEAYGSEMGKMVYKLFQGWNTIYNETQEGAAWPPLADCFPGMGRASQTQKVNAEILWRWASNEK